MIGKEFYGNYIVYPNGIIYSINSKKELSQRIVNNYNTVTLYHNKARKDFKVHRLVAMCFIPNKQNKPFVNHIDGNKLNNNIDNLEWCTHIENVVHAIKNGLINSKGELNPSCKINENIVIKIRKEYIENKCSHRKLSSIFKISKTQVGRILRKESWNHI
jgi:hypothetical protein